MNYNRTDNHRTDFGTVVILALGALMGAVGLLAFWGGITGTDIWELGAERVAGILAGLFGGIFASLLLGDLCSKNR